MFTHSISIHRYSEQETDEQNRFWIINDGVLFNPLRAILTDVRAFVKRSDDVVILDFAAFGMRELPFCQHRSNHKIINQLYSFQKEPKSPQKTVEIFKIGTGRYRVLQRKQEAEWSNAENREGRGEIADRGVQRAQCVQG